MICVKTLVNRDNSCAFSGYRPDKLPWGHNESDERCLFLKARLYEAAEMVYLGGRRHFLCGMALGADAYFCETIIKLREKYPDITLEAAVPCEEQAAKWPEAAKRRYADLLSQCDYETYVSRHFTPDCMTKRNRYMVDNATVLIAVFDGRFGGTMHTVNYAGASGIEIILIDPQGNP